MSEPERQRPADTSGAERHTALVAGDIVADWNFAHTTSSPDDGTTWDPKAFTTVGAQPGGAVLLGEVLAAAGRPLVADDGRRWHVSHPRLPRRSVRPGDPRHHHSFAIWTPMKRGKDDEGWRVKQFLGLQRRQGPVPLRRAAPLPEPELLVLDDGALAFRDNQAEWPAIPDQDGRRPWIVLKMTSDVAKGPLWEEKLRKHADRTIVVVQADDIRRSEVQVSQNVSWERTTQDLLWEITYNPRINSLSRCAYVVVSFNAAGALLLSRNPDGNGPPMLASLYFDPSAREGSWEQEQHEGGIMGNTTCLTAAIAYQAMRNPGEPDVVHGVRAGLNAIRKLHKSGYLQQDDGTIQFPVETVVGAIRAEEPGVEFAEAKIRQPAADTRGPWTILGEQSTGESLEKLARTVVTEGPRAALRNVPLGSFGKLLTVDRSEIESLSSIQNLMREYCKKRHPERPLSIAVFGPPGAGKSFGVKQVASAVATVKELTFNLSQFPGPEALLGALHQVRDVGLAGEIPLVFWDEFDTPLKGELGWLRYFLAPMHDGKFQQGQITHSIGPAIFVFAGGTAQSYRDFNREREPDFVSAKGPDFISRLKGYLDVLGPDSRKNSPARQPVKEGEALPGQPAAANPDANRTQAPRPDDEPSPAQPQDDPFKVLRRAILLRSMLRRAAPQIFEPEPDPKEKQDEGGRMHINAGVLRAFLLTREYRHGARSMESLIEMSSLSGKRAYTRSLLPAPEQLELHVHAQDFQSLIQRLEWEPGDELETLARLNHDIFCDWLRERRYTYGRKTDDAARKHSSLVPWEELPPDEQEQNRSVVRDIPNKLASVGLIMLPARAGDKDVFATLDGDALEKLAEAEHDRWVAQKLASGWGYAPTTDKANKLHQDLLPWTKLSPEEKAKRYGDAAKRIGDGVLSDPAKEKDRQIVRAIPAILDRVGYTVVHDGTEREQPESANTRSGGDRAS